MSEDVRNWNIGLISMIIATIIVQIISNLLLSSNLNLLECWGIVMIGLTIFSGVQVYKENKSDSDADISK